jgi:hypothetical protein
VIGTATSAATHGELMDRTIEAAYPAPFKWQKCSEPEKARCLAFDLYLENVREFDSFEIYRDDTVEQLRQAAIDFANDCWKDFQ